MPNQLEEKMPPDPNTELEQLKLLFDYTKFHIGIYTTIATIFGGLIAAVDRLPFKFAPCLLFAAIIFICIAGAAGGVIASSIPHYKAYSDFWKEENKIGPMTCKILTPERWTRVEHYSFWIAVVLALLSIIVKR